MSESSSTSDSGSHEGGVRLCSPPRRKTAPATQDTATTSRFSGHKMAQVDDPQSPAPTHEAKAHDDHDPGAFHHQTPSQFFKPAYPKMQTPSYNVPSESSSGVGYPPVGRYGSYTKTPGSHLVVHPLLSASGEYASSRIDSLTAGVAGLDLKLHECHKEANRYVRHVQEKLYKINQAIYRQAGLPPQFAQEIDGALKELSQDVGRLGSIVDGVHLEAGKREAEYQRIQATAAIQAVEIERLRSEVEALQRTLSAAEKQSEEVQATYQRVILTMEQQIGPDQEKLKLYQEQLDEKRNLFYTTTQDMEAKAKIVDMLSGNDYREKTKIIQYLIDANPQDKFKILDILMGNNSHVPTRSVSYQPSTMVPIQSSSVTPASEAPWSRPPSRLTPPAHLMRRTPTASFHGGSIARPASAHPSNHRLSQPRSRPSTGHGPRSNRQETGLAIYRFEDPSPMHERAPQEYGSPQPSRARQAVVAQAQMEWDSQIAVWKQEFGKVFGLVHGWVSRYASQVRKFQAAALPSEAPRLWEYMTDMLYPGQPEAGVSHAAFLLDDQECRPYFVERVMLQYIVTNIFSVEAWMDFDEETDRDLKELHARLQSTEVFKSYIRQSTVDKIGTVIGKILADDEFNEYRQRRITFHQQRLKTIVGPLMDEDASRNDAGFDLHNVASAGLQVSAMMFQSRLNFEFHWSVTCSKFSADQHEARDVNVEPILLQQKQYRIKLAVTPTILFRDDRGVSINPKRVARAQVFVMN